MGEEQGSTIHGVVMDEKGEYIKNAVVKLFRAKDNEDDCVLTAISRTITDEYGRFILKPLLPEKRYVIKVWVNDNKMCDMEDKHVSRNELYGMKPNNYTKNKFPQRKRIPGW